jgi:hypothetical protein
MSDIETTKERLENWKQWARDKRHYRITPSLEGKYKAPPSWHPPEPSIHVDILDAIIVEKVLVGLTFPKKAREIIKYSYIHSGMPIDVACRKIGINKRNFDEEMETAIRMLHNRLNK